MATLETLQGYTLNTRTPINSLPPELLTEIFCSAIQANRSFGHIRKALSCTITLCSVCSDWRSLILGIPLLWSHVPVENRKYSHHLTRLCLERSKDSPIDIVARFRSRYHDSDWQIQREINVHIPRIRSVFVSVRSREQVFSLLSHILGNQVPGLLTSLSIRIRSLSNIVSDVDRDSSEITRLEPMQRTTAVLYDQLHALHLDEVFISDFRGWEESSFGQLRELVLCGEHAYYEGMSHIMATANSLQLLEFHGPVGQWTADSSTLKPILTPAQGRKILRLHKLPFGTLRQGIKWIVPELWETEIAIEARLHQPLWVLQNLSTVMTLSLDNSGGPIHSGQYMRKIMEAFPNLHTLTLQRFELVESTLSAIVRPPDAAGAEFPRLSMLRLHSSRVLDYDAFKSVISSHPIRRLELWNCALGWSGKDTYKPDPYSPLYLWLCEQVLEIYISGP